MNNLHIICVTNKQFKGLTTDGIEDQYVHFSDNFITGLNKNIWGFKDRLKNYEIDKIKAGDLVLFIKGVTGTARGKTVETVETIQYKQIVICKATTDLITEESPKSIWIDEYRNLETYPNRFKFEILGSYPTIKKDQINTHYQISNTLNKLDDINESKILTRALLLLMSWVGANAIVENVKLKLDRINDFTDLNQIFDLSNAELVSKPISSSKQAKVKPTVSKKERKKQSKETSKFYEDRLKEILEGLLNGKNEVPRNILARIGQGKFREDLFKFYDGKCLVTGISVPTMLTASHIKPWSESKDDASCRDPANGILLSANIDRLFDRKLISINPDTLLIETSDDPEVQEIISPYMKNKLDFPFAEKNPDMLSKTINYLRYHYSKFCVSKENDAKESGNTTADPN
ncbi:HNH endonuclease [Acinetobacter lwoffii]|uniref:HNH endonuclease n=1 Tax=Acinetobacter lwoffii TaxID=28090 RepID=UPI001FF63803|nr:HNH endonuclease [Acinetobacter lwoffii]MCJ8513045.1 HNH endonuclease [Acinetobacter lwoffii]